MRMNSSIKSRNRWSEILITGCIYDNWASSRVGGMMMDWYVHENPTYITPASNCCQKLVSQEFNRNNLVTLVKGQPKIIRSQLCVKHKESFFFLFVLIVYRELLRKSRGTLMTPNTWRAVGFNKTSEETTCWNSSEILNKVLCVSSNVRTKIKVLRIAF